MSKSIPDLHRSSLWSLTKFLTRGERVNEDSPISEFVKREINITEESAELTSWRNDVNIEIKQEEEDDAFDMNVAEEYLNAQKTVDTAGEKNLNEQDGLLNSEMPQSSSPVPSNEPINTASEGGAEQAPDENEPSSGNAGLDEAFNQNEKLEKLQAELVEKEKTIKTLTSENEMLKKEIEITNTNLNELRVATKNERKEQGVEVEKLKAELKGKEGTIKTMASENGRLKEIHAIAVALNNTNKRQEAAETKKLKAELQEKEALNKKMKR